MKKMMNLVLRCLLFAAAVICTTAVLQYVHSGEMKCTLCFLSEMEIQEVLASGAELSACGVKKAAETIADLSKAKEYLLTDVQKVIGNQNENPFDLEIFTMEIRECVVALSEKIGLAE